MRKQVKKKLYTYYTVAGALDEIRNDPTHIFVSYSSGKAECIKYHDSLKDWLDTIVAGNYKFGFGIRLTTADGKYNIISHKSNIINCTTFQCNNYPQDSIIEIIANVINCYLDPDSYYYEIKDDHMYMCTELTGHIYYRSPYESCDKCGTCDGAQCDYCKTKYIVKNLDTDKILYDGFSKDKAEYILKENSCNYSDIISDIIANYSINMEWFNKEINDA